MGRVAASGRAAKAVGVQAPVAKHASLSARRHVASVNAIQTNNVRGCTATATRATASPVMAMAGGKKKTVIITGASSGLGLKAAKALAASGEWHIVMANRDFSKTLISARDNGIDRDDFTYIQCDLASLESVRNFVDEFRATGRTLDCLVCNAAIYLPTATEPTFTADGYELSVGVNHLSHFLMANLLMEDLQKSDYKRLIIVGSITGNKNTLAGMIPPQADLGSLSGLDAGFKYPNVTIDGGEFVGAKAYKDAKVCNMLTIREMDKRFAKSTGITFSTLYPGCIAETALFRNHVKPFQVLFPYFQKNITQGYVSEEEAGKRLAKVVADPDYAQGGAYWSWSNDSEAFVNTPSDEVLDDNKAAKCFDLSAKLVGLESKVMA